jgi:hypothetical protein
MRAQTEQFRRYAGVGGGSLLLRGGGFEQIASDPDFARLQNVFLIGVNGQEHDAHAGKLLEDAPGGFQAVL